MTAPLTWDEIVDHCSRLHTTRTRPIFPWLPDGQMREDSDMLDVIADGTSCVIVPTRMHEPGFYVRSDGQSDDHWSWRSDEQLATFHRMVDDGRVYLDNGGPAS